jgi:hypothetical protein
MSRLNSTSRRSANFASHHIRQIVSQLVQRGVRDGDVVPGANGMWGVKANDVMVAAFKTESAAREFVNDLRRQAYEKSVTRPVNSVTSEMVTPDGYAPKRARAEYMRQYRARKRGGIRRSTAAGGAAADNIAIPATKSAAKSRRKPKASRQSAEPLLPQLQRRGRKRKGIRERMIAWVHSGRSFDELDRLAQEDLITLFGGCVGNSRQIYCRARDELLMEARFVRSTKSTYRQTSFSTTSTKSTKST